MSSKQVSRGTADSIVGHDQGVAFDLTNTTAQSFDCRPYVGSYVKIRASGGATGDVIYYVWGPLATISTPVIVTSGAAPFVPDTTSQTAKGTAGTADWVSTGGEEWEIISPDAPVINVKASANSMRLTILPK